MGVENTSVVSAPEGRMISLYDIDIQAGENVSTLLAISSKFRHIHVKPSDARFGVCGAFADHANFNLFGFFLATCQIGLSNT